MTLLLSHLTIFSDSLEGLPSKKLLINTINAHSYNIAQKDKFFAEALLNSNVLLPDGISIVFAIRFLKGIKIKKIAGSDLFNYEMHRLNQIGGKCLFLGSNEATLKLISEHAAVEYPSVKVDTYFPPYKSEFSPEDDQKMLEAINASKPDVLFLGMTAPKQEKWAYRNFDKLHAGHVCCIGAVFDFYSGNVRRAPNGLIELGLEWLYRLIREPFRMWRRYLIGNVRFIQLVINEKTQGNN